MPSNIAEMEIDVTDSGKADGIDITHGTFSGTGALELLVLRSDRSFHALCDGCDDGVYQITRGVDSGRIYLRLYSGTRLVGRWQVAAASYDSIELSGETLVRSPHAWCQVPNDCFLQDLAPSCGGQYLCAEARCATSCPQVAP